MLTHTCYAKENQWKMHEFTNKAMVRGYHACISNCVGGDMHDPHRMVMKVMKVDEKPRSWKKI